MPLMLKMGQWRVEQQWGAQQLQEVASSTTSSSGSALQPCLVVALLGVDEFTWSDIATRDYAEADPKCLAAISATVRCLEHDDCCADGSVCFLFLHACAPAVRACRWRRSTRRRLQTWSRHSESAKPRAWAQTSRCARACMVCVYVCVCLCVCARVGRPFEWPFVRAS